VKYSFTYLNISVFVGVFAQLETRFFRIDGLFLVESRY